MKSKQKCLMFNKHICFIFINQNVLPANAMHDTDDVKCSNFPELTTIVMIQQFIDARSIFVYSGTINVIRSHSLLALARHSQ